jgi:hypothetical protein
MRSVSVQNATENSQASFSAAAYSYCHSGPGGFIFADSQPNEDTFLSPERFTAESMLPSGDPSGSLLNPTDILSSSVASGLGADPRNGQTSGIFEISRSDLHGNFLALTAEILSFFSATKGEIAPPIDAAANLYGVYSAFHDQKSNDPLSAESTIALEYASGVAATAVGKSVAGRVSAPRVAFALGVFAYEGTLIGSHFVSNYLGNLTKSVLGAAELSFTAKQAEYENAIYQYSNSPFGAGQ